MHSSSRHGYAVIKGDYRYLLGRRWDDRPLLLWVMLNPATANVSQNDQTLDRCIDFSKRWGYGGLEVVNLFAYRTPYFSDLVALPDNVNRVGPENDRYIDEAVRRATTIVVACGENGVYQGRYQAVCARSLRHMGKRLLRLGVVQNGCPRHPLYLAHDTKPQPF